MNAIEAEDVVFVIGPPCSGKLTFIRENLLGYEVIDLHEIQKRSCTVWDSYLICEKELVEALQRHRKVILRHTLMKAKRRTMYINAVRSVRPDARISCFYSLPDLETYARYDESDAASWNAAHPDNPDPPHAKTALAIYLEEFEVPTIEEGFTSAQHIQRLFPPKEQTP
ncbi:AAA family ATPase [Adlercreutzia sp. ZJ473]|uniref:AAA family ATPase n=1 Tax=Adlercreutzia sp. ZJ473 TaxID=2722822 RepID=UPI0015570844|nr:AAA family ATPase [Adlercreutzia sp. ZJ473]